VSSLGNRRHIVPLADDLAIRELRAGERSGWRTVQHRAKAQRRFRASGTSNAPPLQNATPAGVGGNAKKGLQVE
jgi:hypothetical protein